MTIEIAQQIFTGAVIGEDTWSYTAYYKGRIISDPDLMNLVQRLWLANA